MKKKFNKDYVTKENLQFNLVLIIGYRRSNRFGGYYQKIMTDVILYEY